MKRFMLALMAMGLGMSLSFADQPQKPNVILIMADDMGYECLGCNGSTSYSTPNLDRLAENGIRFTHCYSQPLCTPSRVKIMTGQRNFRNYEYFGYLNPNQRTFGNLMKDAGYATCIAGKWQLNGLSHKLEGNKDETRPQHFGFDEYCLWQLIYEKKDGERYSSPLIVRNGEKEELDEQHYGPDVFTSFVKEFIRSHKDEPFFVYYPMVLVHDPFVPTPDSDDWDDTSIRYRNNSAKFADMMAYTDKLVQQIVDELKMNGLEENTILMFTGDNGTHYSIVSETEEGAVQGAKGNTTDGGTRVPMIASWPEKMKKGQVYDGLIEFSDFYSTLADIAGVNENAMDGESFYPLLNGKKQKRRDWLMVHYDPQWGKRVNAFRNRFVRTETYKLYQDGKFYNVSADPLEENPLSREECSKKELRTLNILEKALAEAPQWK